MKFFRNLKIAQKLIFFVLMTIFFIIIVGFTGYYFINSSKIALETMYKDGVIATYELNIIRVHLQANLANLMFAMNQKNKAARQKFIDDFDRRLKETNKIMNEYEARKMTPEEKANWADFNKALDVYREKREKILTCIKNDQLDEASELMSDLEQEVSQVTTYIVKQSDMLKAASEKTNNQIKSDVTLAIQIIIAAIILSVVLSIFLGGFISGLISKPIQQVVENLKEVAQGNLTVKDITFDSRDEIGVLSGALNNTVKNLKDLISQVTRSVEEISAGSEQVSAATDQTSQGSQQISGSITQLASGAQNQAGSVTKSLDNINQMSIAIKKISENSNNVVQMAESTHANAANGCKQAEHAVNKIQQIKATSTKTSQTANKLSKLGADIEQIVDLIKGIASQTNLLALNAAIEAARAGEHGKGFAVVAEEVKKLAAQSAESTEKITSMIKEIQSETNNVVVEMDISIKEIEEGVNVIESVGKSLSEILSAAKNVNDQAEQSSKLSETLTKDSDNVVVMMEEISSVAEESAAGAEEISSIIEEQTASVEEINASAQSLANIAETLQKQVAIFKIDSNNSYNTTQTYEFLNKKQIKTSSIVKLNEAC